MNIIMTKSTNFYYIFFKKLSKLYCNQMLKMLEFVK